MKFETFTAMFWYSLALTVVFWNETNYPNWLVFAAFVFWVALDLVFTWVKYLWRKRKQPKGEFVRRSRPLGSGDGARHRVK